MKILLIILLIISLFNIGFSFYRLYQSLELMKAVKKTLKQENDFLTFLMNNINPNELEKYLSMYNAQNEKGCDERE